jgi:hypothetical protein
MSNSNNLNGSWIQDGGENEFTFSLSQMVSFSIF